MHPSLGGSAATTTPRVVPRARTTIVGAAGMPAPKRRKPPRSSARYAIFCVLTRRCSSTPCRRSLVTAVAQLEDE